MPDFATFTCRTKDIKTIGHIVDRAFRELTDHVPARHELIMDLCACHCNGTPLDLHKLLSADLATFGHDILGISRHLNRTTGRLGGCFLPRCASPS